MPALVNQRSTSLNRVSMWRGAGDAKRVQLHKGAEEQLKEVEDHVAMPGCTQEGFQLWPQRVTKQPTHLCVAPCAVSALNGRSQFRANCGCVSAKYLFKLGFNYVTDRLHGFWTVKSSEHLSTRTVSPTRARGYSTNRCTRVHYNHAVRGENSAQRDVSRATKDSRDAP